MASSKLEIVNAAVARIGHNTIESFDTPEGRKLSAIYNSELKARLAGHPWKFALRELELTVRTPTEGDIDSRYQNHYLLPDEVILPLGFVSECAYSIRGSTISTFADQVRVGTTPEPDCDPIFEGPQFLAVIHVTEGYFSEPFRLALEYQLASQFATTLTEDNQKLL